MTTIKEIKTPKVFISYSWSSPEHEEKIYGWCERLVSDGIDVRLDKWDLKTGDDKYQYMEGLVTDVTIDKVLCFCDKVYAEKADKREGGVGTEAQILSPELYQKTAECRILPVVCEINDEDGKPYLPTFFNTRMYVNFSNDETFEDQYEHLLRLLFERPLHRKPSLGKPPSHILDEEPRRSSTASKLLAFKHDLETGKKSAKGKAMSYLRSYGEALLEIRKLEREEGKAEDETVIDAINNFDPVKSDLLQYIMLVTDFEDDSSLILPLKRMWEDALRSDDEEMVFPLRDNWQHGAIQFVIRDALTSLIALLIRAEKFNWADEFLNQRFDFRMNNDSSRHHYVEIDCHIPVLQEFRQVRLKSNPRQISVVADLHKQSARTTGIDFEIIMQADFILALRALFILNGRWFPRTLVYAERKYYNTCMPIFSYANDDGYFVALTSLLHVSDWDDFASKLDKAYQNHRIESWHFAHNGIDWLNLSNLKRFK